MRRTHTAEKQPLLPNEANPNSDPDLATCIRIVLVDGRVEGVSAWTHLVAAILFTIYGIVRSVLYDTQSTTGLLASISVFFYAVTFFISAAYHVCVPNRKYSKIMREIDCSAVLISFAVTIATDATFALRAGKALHFQTLLDVGASTAVAILFFAILSPAQDSNSTWVVHGLAIKGTQRRYHSDLDFVKTRLGILTSIMLGWILTTSLIWEFVSKPAATMLLAAYSIGAFMLTITQINDFLQFTDQFLPDISSNGAWCKQVDTHSIWHVVSAISTAFLVLAREYALQSASTR